ncbi:MAG TPA: ATP-binding cassette domain-containing protein [Solirubrobacterales bacterium]
MQEAIAASDIHKRYDETVALDGLTFAVAEGSIFGLLGPNGAGKSTTVKVLTTLTTPDSGEAAVAGLDVLNQGAEVRRRIGVVAQASSVDEEATGRENLVLQGRLYGIRGRELDRKVDGLLERFGLADHGGRIAKGYSGGMKRRLDIAMGLIHDPKVLFLDEPTTGLDPEVRAQMWAEIRRLNAEDGLTILLTTHYLEEADQLAERLAFVDRGKVVVEGPPEQLKAELSGDTVAIEIGKSVNGRAVEALRGLAEVRELQALERAVHARVDDGAAALPALLAALSAAEVPVAAATVARPSLDDVYLRYTGRSFEQAEQAKEKNDDEGSDR